MSFSRQGHRHFSLRYRVQTASGTNKAFCPMDIGASFAATKRPEREADHSHPSRAEVKNVWCLIKSTWPILLLCSNNSPGYYYLQLPKLYPGTIIAQIA
jgi:hypothetical protein